MKKLFLYSDHVIPENRIIDERLLSILGTDRPSVAWVPSGSSPERTSAFFSHRKQYYSELGVSDVQMVPLHKGFTQSMKDILLECDVVHLSGGDPYIFLLNMRATRVLETLRERANNGKSLIGDSAGAILMSRDIEISHFADIDLPLEMKDFSSLGIVDFEIHPHWGKYGASASDLQEYVNRKDVTVYAIPDGCGIAVIDSSIEIFGNVAVFTKDQKDANNSIQAMDFAARIPRLI